MHSAEKPRERVSDSFLEPVPRATDALIYSAVRDKNTVLCHFFLFFSEELGVVWPVWKDEESRHSHQDRRNAFNKD